MKTTKQVLITFDYELFLGNRSGSVSDCLINPTNHLLDVIEQYGCRAIFFVDTTYLLTLKKNFQIAACKKDFETVMNHITEIASRGHEIFPHLHPHWLDAKYLSATNEWQLLNTDKYRLYHINESERSEIFDQSIEILQQRISATDICQYLLDTNPNKYFHVCLPVKVTNYISPVQAIDFYQDGLLWKDRFTEKVILDFQQTLGSRAFAGQLMQKPVAEEGNIFKRAWIKSITLDEWRKLTNNEANIDWNLYIDTAYTAKAKDNDASAAILACQFNNNVYVKKAWKWWLEFPELVAKLKELKVKYNVRMLYIEAKASGLSIKQQLSREGFDCADLTPKDKDKVARANAVSPKVEGGHLWFIEDTWNEMVLSELTGFPFGADDLTDVTVYSIDNLLNKSTFNYSML